MARPPRSPVLLALLLTGCAVDPADLGGAGVPVHVVIGSQRARDLSPVVDPAELAALAERRNRFAFELHQELAPDPGNLAYAPLAVSAGVARWHAGARRDTEQELAETFGFPAEQDLLHAGLNRLDLALTRERTGVVYRDALALWAQIGLPYRVGFLDLLAESYGGELHLVDLAGDPAGARRLVNAWIEEQTAGAVSGLLAEEALADRPIALFADAVTLSAEWREPLPPDLTAPAPFHLDGGGTVEVAMMASQDHGCYRYAAGPGYQAMELGFRGDELSLVLILPDAGQLAAVEAALDGSWWAELLGQLAPTERSIALPRFTLDARIELDDRLAALGAAAAFEPAADFSGVTGNLELHLGGLVHQVRVEVDEVGLDAGAGTLEVSDAEVDRLVFDRPFLFAVRDLATGVILLAGRVSNPVSG